jgi:general secretion pathway protein A
MYNSFFGFREKPFKLVPNPEYLFLSKTHEIALAHLTYATDQGEGFVVIIGEVGTGKTTLCRNYLESLDEDTDSAYIFNPHLDTNDLLVGIIHEYGLRTEEKNTKALLDILNEFLIKQNTVDRKVVLLIDEAQLLSIENLEMVRMLSNLETTKSKLLQIILVGQPELAAKLETYELRQLSQRISLNYHLTPLPREDTEAYIQHRIGIASQRQDKIFTPDACRLVYQYSGGIPRLINIACDRALLTAYSQNKNKVTKAVMQTAIEELSSTSQASASSPKRGLLMVAGGICVLAVLAAGAYFVFRFLVSAPTSPPAIAATEKTEPAPAASRRNVFKVPPIEPAEQNPGKGQMAGKVDEAVLKPSEVPKAPEPTPPPETQPQLVSKSDDGSTPSSSKPDERSIGDVAVAGDTVADVAPVPAATAPKHVAAPNLGAWIGGLDPIVSRKDTAAILLSMWQQPRPNVDLIPAAVDDDSFFDIAARQYGLRNYPVSGDWDLVSRINLPAIVSLKNPKQPGHVYLCLVARRDGMLQLEDRPGGQMVETTYASLKAYMEGPIHIFWKNLLGFDMIIGYGSDDRAVLMVKNLLRKIGYHHISLNPEFDATTRKAIRHFQADHDLKVDGLVGPITKIMLLRESGTAAMPLLGSQQGADS